MKMKIKLWIAGLLAVLCASSAFTATISKSGSTWVVNGGGEITINQTIVNANGYFAGGHLSIGNTSSDNHLIIDAANVQVNSGIGGIDIGSGMNNNTLELKNGATVYARNIDMSLNATGNRLILGEDSQLTLAGVLWSYSGGTLEFAGGTMSVGNAVSLYTGNGIVVSGNYVKGETIFSWNSISSGGSYINSAAALLARFNVAGAGRYEFELNGNSIRVKSVVLVQVDVEFNANGGTPALQTNTLAVGTNYVAQETVSREEYNFVRWEYADGSAALTVGASNHTVYAGWTPANFLWVTNNGKLIITAYIGSNSVVTVPAFIDGLPVVEIGSGAFQSGHSNAHLMTSVTLGSNVTAIGENAFYGLTNLTSIDLSDVTAMSDNAFAGSGLTNVTLNAGQTISAGAFNNTPMSFIFIPTDAPSLIGNPIEESKVVYYLPHTTNWTQFIGMHSNTVALAGSIVETSIEDRSEGFAFDVLGIAGSGMILEAEVIATTTLTEPDWNRVGDTITNLTSVTPIEFVDPDATTNSSRFYKTRVLDAR